MSKLPIEVRKALAAVHNRTASESELQRVVIHYARAHGWLAYHQLPARFADGRWSTALQGDPGFPDLVLVHDLVILSELKRERGVVSAAQHRWLDTARAAGVQTYVWYPRSWPEIKRVLYRPPPNTGKVTG